MKILFKICFFFLPLFSFSQTKKKQIETLENRLDSCYTAIKGLQTLLKMDEELIIDKNTLIVEIKQNAAKFKSQTDSLQQALQVLLKEQDVK